MRANLTRPQGRIFSASLQSRSQFSSSLQTFCLTVRANLNTQKYGLFCSLKYSHLDCSQPSFKALTQRRRRPPRERPQSKATTLHVWHVHHLIWCLFCRHYTTTRGNFLRDGPLENLWGGRAKYKKKSRKGKLNGKNSCTPINPKKYSCYGLKKSHTRNLMTKKKYLGARKFPSPPP